MRDSRTRERQRCGQRASTGLRRSEAQELQWGQVDLERRQITLTDSKGTKLARRRASSTLRTEIVGLPPIAAAALSDLKPENADAARPDVRVRHQPVEVARLEVSSKAFCNATGVAPATEPIPRH